MAKQKSKRRRDAMRGVIASGESSIRPGVELDGSSRLRSISAFIFCSIGLYTIIHALPTSVTRPLNDHTARMLGLVLNAVGIPALTAVDVVSERGLAFQIIPECTPIFTAGLFISFVAFHQASLKQKAVGLVWGIPALYMGNLFRLVTTFAVSRHDGSIFEVTHVYLGQIFTLFMVVLCCILWMRWVEEEEKPQSGFRTGPFLVRFGVISVAMFLVWMRIHHGYIGLLDRLMVFGFSLFGRSAALAHETPVYYETFSIVITISLVLAACKISWRQRLLLLGAGWGVLFLIHLFHRIDNALMALYHVFILQRADLVLLVIGQYLVPVLILILLIHLQRQNLPGFSTGINSNMCTVTKM